MSRHKTSEPKTAVLEIESPPQAEPVADGRKPSKPKQKKPKPEKVTIPRLTVDVLGIREYTGGHFVMQDDSIMDIFQLVGRNLQAAEEADIQSQIHQSARYYRLQQKDIKIITLNYPTNTQNQQSHLRHLLEKAQDPVFQDLLQDEMAALQYLEEYRTEIVNFLFLFADSEKDYAAQRQILTSSSGFSVVILDKEAKIILLRKLANMNRNIKV